MTIINMGRDPLHCRLHTQCMSGSADRHHWFITESRLLLFGEPEEVISVSDRVWRRKVPWTVQGWRVWRCLAISWVCSFLYIQLTWNPFPDDCDRWTKMTTRQESAGSGSGGRDTVERIRGKRRPGGAVECFRPLAPMCQYVRASQMPPLCHI